MFNPFARKRFVVANMLLHLQGPETRRLLGTLHCCNQAIIQSHGDFGVASECLAEVCSCLAEHPEAWKASANWGERFSAMQDAGNHGAECFAELSQRYLGENPGSGVQEQACAPNHHALNLVVAMTVAYQGEVPALETAITSVATVRDALQAILALHHQDRLLLAHVHHVPAHPEHPLDDELLLVSFPELVDL